MNFQYKDDYFINADGLTFDPYYDILHIIFLCKKEVKLMALCYKRLWKLLIDRNMKKKDLHHVTGIAPATIAKMSRDESVTAAVLDKICTSLKCDISDVVEIVPEETLRSVSGCTSYKGEVEK